MDKNEKDLLHHGLGNVTWWGYSPSFNILENVTQTEGAGKCQFHLFNPFVKLIKSLRESSVGLNINKLG